MWIPGYTTTTGPYYFQNTADYEQVIPTADATNPRIETIVARVYDNAVDSSGKHEAVFEALKGTAKAGATLGNLEGIAAVPKNCFVIGYVLVPAKATSIVTADIKNVATAASSHWYEEGVAGSRPTAGVKGRTYYATDSKAYFLDTGAAWNELLASTGQTYSTKAFSKAEAEAEVEPSATRAAIVSLVTTSASWTGSVAVFVGAPATHEAGRLGELKTSSPASTTIFVPAGAKWKTTQPVEAFTILL